MNLSSDNKKRRQKTGFVWTAAGAMLGFIGCVLAMLNPIPDLYNLILYGVTSLSIVLIFTGLYLIFEG